MRNGISNPFDGWMYGSTEYIGAWYGSTIHGLRGEQQRTLSGVLRTYIQLHHQKQDLSNGGGFSL